MVVTAKDLRFNISMLFDALEKGEDIIITYRGKAKAKLISTKNDKLEKEDFAFGMWSDKKGDINKEIREIRKGREFEF